MSTQCLIVVFCLLVVGAVHGDDDVYRWNIICVPTINEGTGTMNPFVMPAKLPNILCAFCQRIEHQPCIQRCCNRPFALTFADVAPVPSVIPPLESYYRRPRYSYTVEPYQYLSSIFKLLYFGLTCVSDIMMMVTVSRTVDLFQRLNLLPDIKI